MPECFCHKYRERRAGSSSWSPDHTGGGTGGPGCPPPRHSAGSRLECLHQELSLNLLTTNPELTPITQTVERKTKTRVVMSMTGNWIVDKTGVDSGVRGVNVSDWSVVYRYKSIILC